MAEHPPFALDLPPTLHKYLAFNPDLPERPADLLLRNRIWFASPLSFNDPFDCFPRFDHSGTGAERMWLTTRSVNRVEKDRTRHDRRASRREILRAQGKRRRSRTAMQQDATIAWSQTIAGMGVLSLTAKSDDLLMWGHYAGAHTGFCLRFDPGHAPFVTAGRVLYVDQRPTFRPLDRDRSTLLERVLLRKATPWAYEEEWRTMKASVTGNVPFEASALTGLILGARISQEGEAMLRGLLARRTSPVELMRATIDHDEYRVRIIPAD